MMAGKILFFKYDREAKNNCEKYMMTMMEFRHIGHGAGAQPQPARPAFMLVRIRTPVVTACTQLTFYDKNDVEDIRVKSLPLHAHGANGENENVGRKMHALGDGGRQIVGSSERAAS
jgi:hypothetical protein